jgi:hypothetical protein
LTLDDWLGVLQISQKYCVDAGVIRAKDQITSSEMSGQLSPAANTHIAWEFNMEDIYEEHVNALVGIRPFPCWNLDDFMDIGNRVMQQVQEVYHRVRVNREQLISYIPPFRHNTEYCSAIAAQQECAMNWREVYATLTRLLSHTERFYSGRELLERLSRQTVDGMNENCKEGMIEYITQGFLREEDTFREGKQTILHMLRFSRPETRLRKFSSPTKI